MRFFPAIMLPALVTLGLLACNSRGTGASSATSAPAGEQQDLKTETVHYSLDSLNMTGYLAYDPHKEGRRPIVLVVPEWWGLNDYARSRADQLAQLGYLAFAVDMYGNGKTAADPEAAGKYSGIFYKDPSIGLRRLAAALAKAKTYPQADTDQTAAIGYCFGGSIVLNAARTGMPFKGVVSFHGNLLGAPPVRDAMKAQILVCHGAADKFVSPQDVAAFKKQMDSVGARYTFKEYAHATHAFTNPDATATGKKFNLPIEYNAAADTASWNEMKAFFGRIFR